MKKRMILVALLAMPLGTLVARCHTCEEPTVRSSCNMCNLGCNSCKTRSYDRDAEVIVEYDTMESNPELTPMYEQQVIEEMLEVPYTEQVVEESTGETPMYSQQVVEESVEDTAAVTGLTAEQRAQHDALMKEIKSTGATRPSQVAGTKKTTTPKKITAKKATTTKKTTAAKKPAKAKTTPVKKTTTTKKATTNGKKVATNKSAKNKAKNKVAKTNNVVA